MEVRLDVRTTSEKETRALGINVGDCVAFDPRVEVTNGFIRSRFLDDKACVANLVAAIKSMVDAGQSPKRTAYFLISNYEEVGHGASRVRANRSARARSASVAGRSEAGSTVASARSLVPRTRRAPMRIINSFFVCVTD